MSEGATVEVVLPPDLFVFVQDAVDSGAFESTSDLVIEALRDMREQHGGGIELSAEELRRLWDEGIASGPGRFGSIEEIKAEARRRFEARKYFANPASSPSRIRFLRHLGLHSPR